MSQFFKLDLANFYLLFIIFLLYEKVMTILMQLFYGKKFINLLDIKIYLNMIQKETKGTIDSFLRFEEIKAMLRE
jgi:hypothetical protein